VRVSAGTHTARMFAMLPRRADLLLFAALTGLTACAGTPQPVPPDEERAGDFLTVTGELAYRERIALLLPGSVMRVSLRDVSAADKPATLLAEQIVVLDGRQVPVAFAVSVDMTMLAPQRRYAVRARLDGPDGEMRWATDTAHAIDPSQATNDLGTLRLVRVPAARTARAVDASYDCEGTAVRARFVDDRVFLTVDAVVHELPRAPAASGARYALTGALPMTFWDKGREALFERDGATRSCERDR